MILTRHVPPIRWLCIALILLCVLVVVLRIFTRRSSLHSVKPPPKVNWLVDSHPRFFPQNQDLKFIRDFGEIASIPSDQDLQTAPLEQLNVIYHSYLDQVDIICHRKLRMGNIGDGGWEICDDYEYRPIQPCIAYSFGINNDYSFDDDLGSVYGCRVFCFDPSMQDTEPQVRSDKVYFFNVGIRGQNRSIELSANWQLSTFSTIRQQLNHTQIIIDVVKMDVEDSEWEALDLMVKEGQLSSVRQLLIEYHYSIGSLSRTNTLMRLQVLRQIEQQGFRRFYVHKNPQCRMILSKFPVVRTQCYEVHYVNTRVPRQKPS